MDAARGIVYNVVGIPSWREVYLKDLLEKRFGVPVYVNNDCNCFALGVSRFGEASAYSDVVCVALGTGVGAGIVIGGELYCGHDTGAGEIGSIPYLDRDYEYYCSSRFFVGRGTTGKEAYERALAGDPAALALWHEFGGHIGAAGDDDSLCLRPRSDRFGGSIAHAFGFSGRRCTSSSNSSRMPRRSNGSISAVRRSNTWGCWGLRRANNGPGF